ncbi:MAG: zinc-dependent metalloprotease [Chitinophagaceae bacterium]|nr:zinc-dependent metalloprotease [Chitinophagaceae bacterium]
MTRIPTRSRKFRNFYLLLIACSLFAGKAYAQTSIITASNTIVQQLNAEQAARYNKVLAQQMHRNYQLVHIEPLATAQSNGRIAVSFTHAPCPATYFKALTVEYNDDDSNYYWYGDLQYTDSSSDCDLGNIMLRVKDGEHFGQLSIQNRVFELLELTGGVQVLAEIDTAVVASGSCGLARATESTATTASGSGTFCKVRVLVLYTSAAKASEASISNRIDLAMDQTSQALLNSNVLPVNLALELAGKQEVEYVEGSYEISASTVVADLNEMVSGALRAQVDYYRSLYQADLVLLLVKASADRVNGVAAKLQDPDYPFAVVQSAIATGVSYTFSHELGHLLGADHEEDEGESSSPSTNYNIAHAHILHFTTTRGFWPFRKSYDNSQKTLVYGGSGGDPSVILNYSNPNVYHSSGAATGKFSSTLGARNAAQQFMNVACTVAAYAAGEPGNLSATVTYEGVCAGKSSLATSHVTGPGGPYSYEWRQSTDGISYGGVTGTSSTLGFTMPAAAGSLFFQLKVTDGSGASVYTYRSPKPRSLPMCGGKITPESGLESSAVNTFSVGPVPAANTINIGFELANAATETTIELYDATRRKVCSLYKGSAGEGQNRVEADISALSNGLYFIHLDAGQYQARQKLLIRH